MLNRIITIGLMSALAISCGTKKSSNEPQKNLAPTPAPQQPKYEQPQAPIEPQVDVLSLVVGLYQQKDNQNSYLRIDGSQNVETTLELPIRTLDNTARMIPEFPQQLRYDSTDGYYKTTGTFNRGQNSIENVEMKARQSDNGNILDVTFVVNVRPSDVLNADGSSPTPATPTTGTQPNYNGQPIPTNGYPQGYPNNGNYNGYPTTGYPGTGYPTTGYPGNGYPTNGYPQGYPNNNGNYNGYPYGNNGQTFPYGIGMYRAADEVDAELSEGDVNDARRRNNNSNCNRAVDIDIEDTNSGWSRNCGSCCTPAVRVAVPVPVPVPVMSGCGGANCGGGFGIGGIIGGMLGLPGMGGYPAGGMYPGGMYPGSGYPGTMYPGNGYPNGGTQNPACPGGNCEQPEQREFVYRFIRVG